MNLDRIALSRVLEQNAFMFVISRNTTGKNGVDLGSESCIVTGWFRSHNPVLIYISPQGGAELKKEKF